MHSSIHIDANKNEDLVTYFFSMVECSIVFPHVALILLVAATYDIDFISYTCMLYNAIYVSKDKPFM